MGGEGGGEGGGDGGTVVRVAMAARAGMRSEVMPWVAVRAATHPLVLLERVVAALERMAGGGKPDQARLRTWMHTAHT